MARQSLLVLVAAIVQVLLSWGLSTIDTRLDPGFGDAPTWYVLLQGPLNGIVCVLPALAFGFLAKRDGLLLGAVSGLLAGPVQVALVLLEFDTLSASVATFALLVSAALGTALIAGVAGGAGELLARRQADAVVG